MKTIKVYTNFVFGGWSPRDLETGIGGSEEKLIEWARELASDYDITIYHNGEHGDFDGVKYRDRMEFKPWEHCDIFISFKAKNILDLTINADKVIHWTTEIENWRTHELDVVDQVVTISDYHRKKMFPAHPKIITDYIWADLDRLALNSTEKVGKQFKFIDKEKGSMLYCSSIDRGLEELLANWKSLKKDLGVKKLYVTYGWNFFNNVAKQNPSAYKWKDHIERLMLQEGIEYLGRLLNDEISRLYWKCEYWCLPLNNPDSELFCINAVKAQYCGCIPVVRRIGALQETVNHFIDWDALIGQKHGQSTFSEESIDANKEHAKKFGMENAITRWKKLLG